VRRAALILLLVATWSASAATRLDALRGDAASKAFEQASTPRTFEFPLDHGPHPGFRHEWWYITGHLDGDNGERFGFELTFFRYALTPHQEPTQPNGKSAWRTNQIYLAHFAVTDLARREFHFTERYSREALGLAGARSAPLRVWLEDWSLAATQIQSNWILYAASDRYVLDLDLQPLMAPVLNGDRGVSRKSDAAGAASYYYSIPRLAVRGQMSRDGKPIRVQGLAWLDREWGSGALSPNQQGWDWFALQLNDGSSLMFYALRRRDGRRDFHSAGTWVAPDGSSLALANNDVRVDVLKQWNSPRGGTYPAEWRLRLPRLALDIRLRPLLADQELLTNPRYWEGAVVVEGQRNSIDVTGQGYVELVGYAASQASYNPPKSAVDRAP
jgi:predicted secreted hydrolase